MDAHASLSDREMHALTLIRDVWVCASYWEDETITRYRELGFVIRREGRILLTEAGWSAAGGRPEREAA